jgi:hypothetical protein
MMSRILFSAFLALAAFGTSVESFAGDNAQGYHRRGHHHYSRGPRHHEFYAYDPIGGYLFGWQHRPFNYQGAAGNNYPGYYNNQSFWERVQTQANYPVQY